MWTKDLSEENLEELRHIFTAEDISCLCICLAAFMTLMVLFLLSLIWQSFPA